MTAADLVDRYSTLVVEHAELKSELDALRGWLGAMPEMLRFEVKQWDWWKERPE